MADEQDYLRVVRSIHLYQLKEKYFKSKGFASADTNLVRWV